jgi:hypothetical protein
MLKRTPYHPLLLAAFPVLQLAAHNIEQIDPGQALRPLLIALAAAALGLVILPLVVRNRQTAGLVLSLGLLLFFSYGHLYALLKQEPLAGLGLGRHRYLVPAYAAALLLGLWAIRRSREHQATFSRGLNWIAAALLIFPVMQIGSFLTRQSAASDTAAEFAPEGLPAGSAEAAGLPDIYYIILDMHTRSDALLKDLGFDNSAFIREMREQGFYVAECARSNYEETLSSLTSALNLDYLSRLRLQLAAEGLGESEVRALLKNSLVRRNLESLGYQTVAFQTGYIWSEMRDADVFLSLSGDPLLLQRLTPFESLLLESSAYKLWLDSKYRSLIARFGAEDYPHRDHIELQLYILDQLPRIAGIDGPTFTFAHVLIPHPPFVFGPDGEIRTDPGFYSGLQGGAIDEQYEREGYTGQVAFIDGRMSEIAAEIIRASDTPPIFIIQGDHGLSGHNRLQILNMYYFPGVADSGLYPSITPVNSFRVLFNAYFGAELDLLPDHSFDQVDESVEVKEPEPACQVPAG